MKVGCVVVGSSNEIRATGFNGLPRRIDASVEKRHSRENDEKYFWYEHAERNAIYNAARAGASLEGCRMYISHFPCSDCTRGMIQSGIIEVCTFPPDRSHSKFAPHYDVAEEMFAEAGIRLRLFDRDDPLLRAVDEDYRALSARLISS